jgi:formylglycine-generating enzyme required for sulfatase activity
MIKFAPLLLAAAWMGCAPRAARPAGAPVVEWVKIPGGNFLMGDPDGEMDQKPAHPVKIRSFSLAKAPVTFKQYNACVDAGVCRPPMVNDRCHSWDGKNWREGPLPKNFQGDDQPVICVDYSDAETFSRWVGGRLPTEAEWEYAARGAGKRWKFPWGGEKPDCSRAVMVEDGMGCGRGTTWPVCSKPAGNTAQGLCDMIGNVWEWLADYYHDSYQGAPNDGRAWDLPAGTRRMTRGGAWSGGGWPYSEDRPFVSVYSRGTAGDGSKDAYLGFRPARD